MDASHAKPPFLSVVELRTWTPNRAYRVYVLPDEWLFVWAGGSGEVAVALGAQGGLIGGLLAAAANPAKKNAQRADEIDFKPLDELRHDHKHNFALPIEEIADAEIVPVSFGFRLSHGTVPAVGLLRLRLESGKRLTLALGTFDELGRVFDLLPPLLGDRFRSSVPAPTGKRDAPAPRAQAPTASAARRAEHDRPQPTLETPPRRGVTPILIAGLAAGLLIGAAATAWFWRPGNRPAENRPDPNPAPKAAPQFAHAEPIPQHLWQPFRSEPGRFTIEFPGQPTHQEKEIAFAVGKVRRFAYAKTFGNPDVSFWADYMDLSPEQARECPPQRCFDYSQDRMLGQLKDGKVIVAKARALGAHPGWECLLADLTTEVAARLAVVPIGDQTRLFLLMVRGVNERPNPADVARFFDSFRYEGP